MEVFNWFKRNFVSALCLGILLIFPGCKSSDGNPEPKAVHPLALLSSDSSIYVNVSVPYHQELTASILCSQVQGLSEKDALSLAERLDNLYIGLGTVKDRSRLEVASLVDIPKVAVKSVFSKKHGWKSEPYVIEEKEFNIYSRQDTEFKVALPENDYLCVGQDIKPLLDKFSLNPAIEDTPWNNWINEQTEEILFYITKPGQYLRNLIGIQINLGTDAIYGSLTYVPDEKKPKAYSGKYELSFNMHLQDKRAMDSFKSLLALSFGMMGVKISAVDDLTVRLSGVEVTENQIKELFTRDPVTGKHFRVEGEKIITEPKK